MTKVQVHEEAPKPAAPAETPTQQVVNAANAVQMVTDATGRRLGWRKLRPLESMRMSEIVGPMNVQNPGYMLYAVVAFSVTEIDGEPVRKPNSKLELEARVQALGDDGIEALVDAIMPQDAASTDAVDLESAKN